MYRSLKAIVLPIVFVNVIIAVVEMMAAGTAGGIGGKTVALYLGTTLIAGTFGAVFASIFSQWFAVGDNAGTESATYFTLGCNGDNNSFLAHDSDGAVTCTADFTSENDIMWLFGDVNNSFVMKDGLSVEEISLSDTIYNGVFMKLVTDK